MLCCTAFRSVPAAAPALDGIGRQRRLGQGEIRQRLVLAAGRRNHALSLSHAPAQGTQDPERGIALAGHLEAALSGGAEQQAFALKAAERVFDGGAGGGERGGDFALAGRIAVTADVAPDKAKDMEPQADHVGPEPNRLW